MVLYLSDKHYFNYEILIRFFNKFNFYYSLKNIVLY